MKIILKIGLILLGIASCAPQTIQDEKALFNDQNKDKTIQTPSGVALEKIPEFLIITQVIDTTNLLVIKDKCVVMPLYSESDLMKLKDSVSSEDWDVIYDDYSYYENEASMALDSITKVIPAIDKKYIQFVFSSGKKITVDRFKAVTMLLFFNPEKSLLQTSVVGFEAGSTINY